MAKFYFDGHSGVSDPDSAWTNESNIIDGSLTTIGSSSGFDATESSGFLKIEGTNASDIGTINSVKVRIYGYGGTSAPSYYKVYTDGLSESLMLDKRVPTQGATYGPSVWVELNTPTGGWTWAKLQELEFKAWHTDSGVGAMGIAQVELVVNEPLEPIYYFDSSDAAPSDPNSVWTNEDLIGDADFLTAASASANGSTASNYLLISGTNAPPSGLNPISVQVRGSRTGSFISCSAAIYTDGLGELLGTVTLLSSLLNWTTLTAPTGGWTWEKIQALETKIYFTANPDGTGGTVHDIQLQVITDSVPGRIYSRQGFQ